MNLRYLKPFLPLCIGVCVAMTLFPSIANAKCVPPKIELTALKGQPGSMVTVTGQRFWLRCNDVVINAQKPPAPEPARDIKILFKQGDRSVLLTTVKTADAKLKFSVTVAIPADALIGSASVVAEDNIHRIPPSRPVEFEVTR
jgi:hypothetical protein